MDHPDTAQPRPRNAAVINDYRQLREQLRAQHRGQRIVCTIGSWDILHEGHVAYLKEAREQGDVLVVGVDSDEAYKFYKKESAFYPEVDRQAIVAALRYVDYVTTVRDVSAEGEWGMDLVRTIEPDVFVCNDITYSLEQRTRLEDLCSGVVRSLPFHDSQSVHASVNLKRAGRMSPQRTALVAAIVSFMVSLPSLYLILLPHLSSSLANWSSLMRKNIPLLPTFTWAQFIGGLVVGLIAAGIAAGVRRVVWARR